MEITKRSWSYTLFMPTWFKLRVFILLYASTVLVWFCFDYLSPLRVAVRTRLNEADSKSKQAIDARMKPVTELFARGRKGAKGFAKEALSWGGKWALVKGIAVKDAHREFLAEAFGRHIFTPEELRDAIETACKCYADDLNSVENEMLVKLRADLAKLDEPPSALAAHLQNPRAFAEEYQKLANRLTGQTTSNLAVGVGREVLVLIGTEIATRAALQAAEAAAAEIGVQGGVLGVGASSTVVTLGVGLIIAVIIDYVIDLVFKMTGYDPEAKIEATVIESINKMEAALTRDAGFGRHFSDEKDGSLRAEMKKIHESRSKLRWKIINQMLNKGDGK